MTSLLNEAVDKVDNVNHPSHYVSHPSGVEAINITREFSFVLGNAWKYLMRFRYKGKPKEDLDKAVWYMNDYMCHGCAEKESEFAPTKTAEKTDEIIKNARAVIAAETVPEVKHAMRSILEHALFGTDVACDFFKAKVELEVQTEKIAKSLLLGDDFDVVSANVILGADELLKELEESDNNDRKRREEYEKQKEAERAQKEKEVDELKDAMWENRYSTPETRENGFVNVTDVIKITVDDTTHTVVKKGVELDPKHNYHAESVIIPETLANEIDEERYKFAESVVANGLAMRFPKPESVVEVTEETPTPETPKKRRRRKKTEE